MPRGASWRWTADLERAGDDWPSLDHDDADWSEGRAPLGYGADDLATQVSPPTAEGQLAVFFRRRFQVEAPGAVLGLGLELRRDDGARVFLNGREVLRNNLPGGRLDPTTRAPLAIGGEEEERYVLHTLPPDLLHRGENVLAVAVHQSRARSSDLIFDLSLTAYTAEAEVGVLRGPYLQLAGEQGVTIRWVTSRPVRGRVRFGREGGPLDGSVVEDAPRREHEVALTGLSPGVRYRYAIGTPQGDLAGGDAEDSFQTAPPRRAAEPLRIWVTGDPGSGNEHARAVRDAYLEFARRRPAQLWLTLGDNAYPSGTPSDYQAHFFDVYAEVLRGTPLWPAIGNHDMNARDPLHGSPAYFRLFSLPTAGEAGGVPSGTEHWYSFDWGNVHFVVLDSDKSDRSPEGPMLSWLREDLARDDSDWVLAVSHHAPFSRGTHHDDREIQARDLRSHVVPLLEAEGVDLVLSGHNHDYERSFLLRGPHPGTWAFDPGRVVSRASGRPDEGDPYRTGGGQVGGTVYVVVGSSGQTGPAPLDHPAMAVGLEVHGSLVLDVEGCRLEAVFLDEEAAVRDHFAIAKGPPCGARSVAAGLPEEPSSAARLRGGSRAPLP